VNPAAQMSPRAKRICVIIALLFLVGPAIGHFRKSLWSNRGDWLSIYNIADHSVRTGKLWADETEKIVRTQRYPPITRPLLMLFALPPKPVAAVLSFALFAMLYGWSAAKIAEVFPLPKIVSGTVAAGVAIAVVAPYVWADLTAGNLTSVLLACVTGAYVFAQRGKPLRAGVILSVGIMLKMIPALCLIYFLFRKQWRVFVGVVLGVVVIGVIPSLLIFGPSQLIDYHGYWYHEEFAKFTPMRTIEQPIECTYQNQAFVRTLIRLFTPINAGHSGDPFYIQIADLSVPAIKTIYIAVMIASLGGLVWVCRRSTQRAADGSPAAYALCVGAMLWMSPWAGSYYFSLAMWPAMALVARWDTSTISRVALVAWFAAMPTLASLTLRAYSPSMFATLTVLIAVGIVALTAARFSASGGLTGELGDRCSHLDER
jgi:hypothetical protein